MQRLLLTTIISLLSLFLYAQPNAKQKGIEGNLRSIDTLLSNKSLFQSLSITPELSSIDIDDINNWAKDLEKSKFAESGLEVAVGYEDRLFDYDKIGDIYEGGNIIAYKHRFLVSLKWNIMQSGLVGRENFRQRVDILSRTKSQEVANATIRAFVEESIEQQIVNLYGYYNVLIDAKAELYSALIEMQEELSTKNKATILSLSDMYIERTKVLRMRKNGAENSNGVIDLDSYVASQTLFVGDEYNSLIEENNAILQNTLEQELVQNEADGIAYWREIKVSPYVRVSNYLDAYNNNKNIGNLGISASFPIFTGTISKRREVLSRGKLLANDEQQIRRDISHNIANLTVLLNENLATLQVFTESIEHYNEGCRLAAQYYSNKTMTIHELSQRYIDNLDNNIEICKLIIEREEIKYALFKVIYGV